MPGLDLALHHRVVGRVDVLVQGRGNLLDLEGRQEAVVDALLERVDEDRLAEVGVGIDVVLALGRGGQAQLNGWGEVVRGCRARCSRRWRRRGGTRRSR